MFFFRSKTVCHSSQEQKSNSSAERQPTQWRATCPERPVSTTFVSEFTHFPPNGSLGAEWARPRRAPRLCYAVHRGLVRNEHRIMAGSARTILGDVTIHSACLSKVDLSPELIVRRAVKTIDGLPSKQRSSDCDCGLRLEMMMKSRFSRLLTCVTLVALASAGSASVAVAQQDSGWLWNGGTTPGGSGRETVRFNPQYPAGQIIVSFGDRHEFFVLAKHLYHTVYL